MTVTLYEFGPTRSIRARWTLQELEVPFESVVVNLLRGDHRRPEFLALNPAGNLPVLVDGDRVVTESVAIVLYLAEKFADRGLLLRDVGERGQCFRWLLFAATELEQPLWRIARHTRLYPEADRLAADVGIARREFTEMAAVLERHMRGRTFIAGDRVSVADFVVAYSIGHTRPDCSASALASRRTWSGCTHGRTRRCASQRRSRRSPSKSTL
jgi:glutathione S-transferase